MNEWISVKDKLSEIDVLVKVIPWPCDHKIEPLILKRIKQDWCFPSGLKRGKITGADEWMPLPELPR